MIDVRKVIMHLKSISFNAWYVFVALLVLLALQSVLNPQHTQTVSYSEFKLLLRAGTLNDVVVGEEVITGTLDSSAVDALVS